jgi:hypothetical protein
VNSIKRNIDALRASLAQQQTYNEAFGHADPRIDAVIRYLDGDYDRHTWPRPMRDAVCVEHVEDWNDYLAPVMANMLLAVARREKPTPDQIASLKHRLKRCRV